MTRRSKLFSVALILLAGCTPTAAAPQRGPDLIVPVDDGTPERGATTGRECRNAGLDQFRGRQATSALGTEMLRQSGAARLRWVAHEMMVTMEFNPERLTVHLDPANRVERATCG